MGKAKTNGRQQTKTLHVLLPCSLLFLLWQLCGGACGGNNGQDNTPVVWHVKLDGRGDFTSVSDCTAKASSGDTCLVYAGTYYGPVVLHGTSVTLRSVDGPDLTVLDGDGVGPVLTIMGQGEEGPAIVDGFTITGGYALQGGGIYIQEASPAIEHCIITRNTAQRDGGGVFCFSSDARPTISHTVISYNEAGQGLDGEARGAGICALYSSPTLFNCLIHENSARGGPQGGKGGGIFAGYGATVIVQHSTIAENTTEQGQGGALYVYEASMIAENAIIWGNSAPAGPVAFLNRSMTSDRKASALLDHVDLDETEPLHVLVDAISGEGCRADPRQCTLTTQSVLQANPLFVPQESFYLSHGGIGDQIVDSPCINAGNTSPQEAGLAGLTTCTCQTPDDDIVDLGYHYAIRDSNRSHH